MPTKMAAISRSRVTLALRMLFHCRAPCAGDRQPLLHKNTTRKLHSCSVYVHWPYCSKLCAYCNFNKYLNHSGVDEEQMRESLLREIENVIRVSGTTHVSTVFFGGGTPSLATSGTIGAVLEKIAKVACAAGAEVTLEANPTEWRKFKDFRGAGVSRLSLGIQALNDNDLQRLNRNHCREEALRAIEHASSLFPGHVNLDLIFGRQGQTLQSWKRELSEVMQSCDGHMSLYQLTVEHGTPLARAVKQGTTVLPDEETMADLYIEAVGTLEAHGLMRYEVSNFARHGAECRHNQAYWRGQEYLGVGPGAHSRFTAQSDRHTTLAEVRIHEPKAWMRQVLQCGLGTRRTWSLTPCQRLEEVVMTSLRTREGITPEIWDGFAPGMSLDDVFGHSDEIRDMIEGGFLILDTSGLRASWKGLNVLDSFTHKVIHQLQRLADIAT